VTDDAPLLCGVRRSAQRCVAAIYRVSSTFREGGSILIGVAGAVLGAIGIAVGIMGLRARRIGAAQASGQPRQVT
jgi:hypothetical protein